MLLLAGVVLLIIHQNHLTNCIGIHRGFQQNDARIKLYCDIQNRIYIEYLLHAYQITIVKRVMSSRRVLLQSHVLRKQIATKGFIITSTIFYHRARTTTWRMKPLYAESRIHFTDLT